MEITPEQRLTIARAALNKVYFDDDELGGLTMDTKRPFGFSGLSIAVDMAEILNIELPDEDTDPDAHAAVVDMLETAWRETAKFIASSCQLVLANDTHAEDPADTRGIACPSRATLSSGRWTTKPAR